MKGVAIRPFYAFFMKLGISTLLLATALTNSVNVSGQLTYTRYWETPTQEYTNGSVTLRVKQMTPVTADNIQIHQKLIWYRYVNESDSEVTEKVVTLYTYRQLNQNQNNTYYTDLNITETQVANIIPTENNIIYNEWYSYALPLTPVATATYLNNFILDTYTYNFDTINTALNYATNDSYYDDTAQLSQTPQANIIKSNKAKQYILAFEISKTVNYEEEGLPLNPNQQLLINFYNRSDITVTYTVAVDPSTFEVVDIPNLMFTILGMPFAWISTAFNLTLFPDTPYAINISHIFFAVIGSLLLIYIIKKILK